MKLNNFLNNGTFDINCSIELYVPPKGMAWYDCGPEYIGYGNSMADDIPERFLNADIVYMTTNSETDAIVLEIRPEPRTEKQKQEKRKKAEESESKSEKEIMWVFEACDNSLVTNGIAFQKECPDEEQLKFYLCSKDFLGKADVMLYKIEGTNVDREDVIDYLDANDADDLVSVYAPEHGWEVGKARKMVIVVPEDYDF